MNILKLLAASFSAPAAPKSIAYIGTTKIDVDTVSNSYTFTGVDIGTPEAGRLVVISVIGASSTGRTITGVTVNGVAATQTIKRDGANTNGGIYQIANTTDSTADIVVTFSGTENRGSISVWNLFNLSSNTAEDSTSNFSTSNSVSTTVNGTAGGFIIAQGTINTTGRTVTWTNATEQNEETLDAAIQYSAAHNASAAGGSVSVTTNWANATNKTIIAARWF